jgi:2-polyprenyl-3-methyl-5-hydroxy-6-metoxy-1,4-benzoquinol methylase
MIYERLENCPSCEHPKFENHLICEDYTVSHESFALVKCTKCSLIFTNPRPSPQSLPEYYKSRDYISHTDQGNSLINFIYKLIRNYTVTQKENLISRYSKKGTLLDYGCGTGHFLKHANKLGWHTFGYEPDVEAIKIAKTKSESYFISSITKISQKIDVITAWHVLEHVTDLRATLRNLYNNLVPGGYMFIAVPNLNSYDAYKYKEHWAAYDVPRHLYHFSRKSFQQLVTKQKLKIIHIEPMKFDSFYVSLLSEKNKLGKNNFINAFKTGIISNRKASKSGEYSSLIYILKK